MQRRNFLKNTGLLGASVLVSKLPSFAQAGYPTVRVAKRNFTSASVEKAITEFSKNVADKELVWLFNNCFPNTLDTTVDYTEKDGKPDTYVITGDIDAMWLRDSSAQVYPYLHFVKEDKDLQKLVVGVINHQTKCVIKDPYANAFYNDPKKVGEWGSDDTKMQC